VVIRIFLRLLHRRRNSVACLPLGEREDVGDLTALVSPRIDRPEFVALAVLDHRRVVRALGEYEPRRRRGDGVKKIIPQATKIAARWLAYSPIRP